MFVVTLSKASVKKLGVGAMCCALVVFSAMLGRYISTRSVAVAAASNKIESAQDIQTWFTGYGLDVDGASITADKVKIPRKWDDSFSAFNGVVQQSGMDLARYKGKTVEKWTALIPAASRRCEQLRRAAGLQEKGRGCVSVGKALRHRHRAERRPDRDGLQEAEQVSGEDFSGDWGERHDGELGAESQAQQTSGEDFSGDWGERHDGELGAEGQAQQTSGEDFSGDWGERHDGELGAEGQAQQTSGEDFSGDWGERHDGELGAEGQAQQTSGEPDAAQEQPVQYTDLPLDAEGYPVE